MSASEMWQNVSTHRPAFFRRASYRLYRQNHFSRAAQAMGALAMPSENVVCPLACPGRKIPGVTKVTFMCLDPTLTKPLSLRPF